MAHTPLFAALKRALHAAAHLEHTGTPTAVGLEQEAERAYHAGLSRRDFLKLTGTAAAGAAFVGALDMPLPALQTTPPNIAIIGAGLAGLTAAYRLRKAGYTARVYEAQPRRVGGRVLTSRGVFRGNQIAEVGGEFIDTGHEALLNLAKELGLTAVDLQNSDGRLQTDIFYFGGKKIAPEGFITELRALAKLAAADLATLTGDDVTYDAPNGGDTLDKLSLAEWLDQKKITGTTRQIIDVAYLIEYGLPPGEQSVFNLLWLLGVEGGDSGGIFGVSDERYHLSGGNDALATRLAAQIGSPVQAGYALEAIRPNGTGYTLNFLRDASAQEVKADIVILTLPFTALRRVDTSKLELPEVKRKAIETLGYGANSKVMAGFRSRIWRTKYNSNGGTYSDLPYQTSWETVRYQPGTGGILTDYLGGPGALEVLGSDQRKTTEDFIAQLEPIYPGITNEFNITYQIADWPKQPYTLASYAAYKPGQVTTIRGAEGEPVGNLFFAGEHTSLEYQGYMNGAVESGERVAEEVLTAVGAKK
jgi:monoamine oxidase